MDTGRLGHEWPRKAPTIGDLVICVDVPGREWHQPRRFIGLVLDKSTTIYTIHVVATGKEVFWPQDSTYLWKETT